METKSKKVYYNNGNIEFDLKLTLNGLQHGIQKIYFENGQIRGIWHKVNGYDSRFDQ